MNFDQSTQAKCWMFDRESLMRCKQQAAIFDATGRTSGPMRSKPSTRNFACGFQQHSDDSSETRPLHAFVGSSLSKGMATGDQEILVHFHSHQIQRLVGPNAIFPELRRSASVLSTAIMLFRRFYLSNSVIDFHPRNIAAASALLSAKVECERSLEVSVDSGMKKSCGLVISYACLKKIFGFFTGTPMKNYMLIGPNIPNVGGELSGCAYYFGTESTPIGTQSCDTIRSNEMRPIPPSYRCVTLSSPGH